MSRLSVAPRTRDDAAAGEGGDVGLDAVDALADSLRKRARSM